MNGTSPSYAQTLRNRHAEAKGVGGVKNAVIEDGLSGYYSAMRQCQILIAAQKFPRDSNQPQQPDLDTLARTN